MSTAALVAGWTAQRWPRNLPGPMLPAGQSPTIQALAQDVWPERILVTVEGLALGDLVTVWRSVAGVRTAVRGMDGVTAADPSLVVVDAEQPFGVTITYVLDVGGVDIATASITSTLVGGKVAVTDAITGAAAEVVIVAWPSKRRERVSTTYVVGGRNVVVSGTLAPPTSEVELFTETDSARENLTDVLETCTAGTVLVRQDGTYPDVDAYLAVTGADLVRWSQDGSDPRRRWTLSAVEVEAWATAEEARGFTYEDVANAYEALTYAALAADYATYLDVARGDYS